MKKKIYGAYGSNMNIEQMQSRCPNAAVLCTGTLADYELTFRGRAWGVANIENRQGASVPFVLWEITPACERSLDRYEGYPTLYVKKNFPIVCEGGETRIAMVYVMAEEYESMSAEPSKEYTNTIAEGYKDNGLSDEPLFEAIRQTQEEINLIQIRKDIPFMELPDFDIVRSNLPCAMLRKTLRFTHKGERIVWVRGRFLYIGDGLRSDENGLHFKNSDKITLFEFTGGPQTQANVSDLNICLPSER